MQQHTCNVTSDSSSRLITDDGSRQSRDRAIVPRTKPSLVSKDTFSSRTYKSPQYKWARRVKRTHESTACLGAMVFPEAPTAARAIKTGRKAIVCIATEVSLKLNGKKKSKGGRKGKVRAASVGGGGKEGRKSKAIEVIQNGRLRGSQAHQSAAIKTGLWLPFEQCHNGLLLVGRLQCGWLSLPVVQLGGVW